MNQTTSSGRSSTWLLRPSTFLPVDHSLALPSALELRNDHRLVELTHSAEYLPDELRRWLRWPDAGGAKRGICAGNARTAWNVAFRCYASIELMDAAEKHAPVTAITKCRNLHGNGVYLTKDNNLSDVRATTSLPEGEVAMLTLTVVAMLSGAVLGLRYKVLILAPAITFALVFVTGVGFAREAGIWWIALDMVVVTTALQLGYLGGSALAAARSAASSATASIQHRVDRSRRERLTAFVEMATLRKFR